MMSDISHLSFSLDILLIKPATRQLISSIHFETISIITSNVAKRTSIPGWEERLAISWRFWTEPGRIRTPRKGLATRAIPVTHFFSFPDILFFYYFAFSFRGTKNHSDSILSPFSFSKWFVHDLDAFHSDRSHITRVVNSNSNQVQSNGACIKLHHG